MGSVLQGAKMSNHRLSDVTFLSHYNQYGYLRRVTDRLKQSGHLSEDFKAPGRKQFQIVVRGKLFLLYYVERGRVDNYVFRFSGESVDGVCTTFLLRNLNRVKIACVGSFRANTDGDVDERLRSVSNAANNSRFITLVKADQSGFDVLDQTRIGAA